MDLSLASDEETNAHLDAKEIIQILNIRQLFCRFISEGESSNIKSVYLIFKHYLENPLCPIINKSCKSSPYTEPIMVVNSPSDAELLKANHCHWKCVNHSQLSDIIIEDKSAIKSLFMSKILEHMEIDEIYGAYEKEMELLEDFMQKIYPDLILATKKDASKNQPVIFEQPFLVLDIQYEVLQRASIDTILTAHYVCKEWRQYALKLLSEFQLPFLATSVTYPSTNRRTTNRVSVHRSIYHFMLEYDLICCSVNPVPVHDEAFISKIYDFGMPNGYDRDKLTQYIFNEHSNVRAYILSRPEHRYDPHRFYHELLLFIEITYYFGLGVTKCHSVEQEDYSKESQVSFDF